MARLYAVSGHLCLAHAHEAKEATWYVHELGSGQVQRAVSLPTDVDVDHAQASFEHGILKIVLPKAEQAKPTVHPDQHQRADAGDQQRHVATPRTTNK